MKFPAKAGLLFPSDSGTLPMMVKHFADTVCELPLKQDNLLIKEVYYLAAGNGS